MKNKKDPDSLFLKRNETFLKLEEENDELEDIIIGYIKTINKKLDIEASIGTDNDNVQYEKVLYFYINFEFSSEIYSNDYQIWIESFIPDLTFGSNSGSISCAVTKRTIRDGLWCIETVV